MKSNEILDGPLHQIRIRAPLGSQGVPVAGRSPRDPQGIPGRSPGCPQEVPWELMGGPRPLRKRKYTHCAPGDMGIKWTSAISINTLWNKSEEACDSSMGTWARPSGS